MNIFSKLKEKGLSLRKPAPEEIVIAVPDIKEYLVKEYERVNGLMLVNEGLKQELEKSEEIRIKYDAAMVTLDEYSKRLELAEGEIIKRDNDVNYERKRFRDTLSELNSYKIKFKEIAVTKEEIKGEITEDVKKALISAIQNHKGALSKKTACKIIGAYKAKLSLCADRPEMKGGAEE